MEQPNYYSILTADVRYDPNLSASEKICYSEITALANKYGYCYATNGYFAKLYGVKKYTITRWIKNLEKNGYVFTELIYKENSKEVDKRKIYIVPTHKKNSTYPQKSGEGYSQKCEGGTHKNVGENNTSINTINKNNSYSQARPDRTPKDPSKELRKDIISYLNKKTNKNYKPNSNKTKSLINARFNEGFQDLNDYKKVIDVKTDEWQDDPKMEKFLRPETLFGNKFEGYLNQTPKQKGYMDDKVDSYYEKLKAEEERILNGDNAEYFN